jgi:type II secretory ATPase GspE/PulE/Tfp pilus assembly ATPase PilB-like protein
LAEIMARHNGTLAGEMLRRTDTGEIRRAAEAAGFVSLWRRGCEAVAAGITSPAELRRVGGTGSGEALDFVTPDG